MSTYIHFLILDHLELDLVNQIHLQLPETVPMKIRGLQDQNLLQILLQPIRKKVPKQDVECATKKSILQTLLVADVARYFVQNIDIQNYMDVHLITEQRVENNLRKQTQWSFCPNCLKYNDNQIMLLQEAKVKN